VSSLDLVVIIEHIHGVKAEVPAFWQHPLQCQSHGQQGQCPQLCKEDTVDIKCLSLILPPQAHEKNEVTPCGHMEMNTLAVLACLYCDHIADLATK